MRYEINPETFAIDIFHDEATIPFWHQPDYPNGDKFDSVEEAETWAKLAVKSHDDAYGFTPPDGKGLPENPKPTEDEIRLAKLARTGLTVEDLKKLLA
jgi:hypothetical protein